MPPKNAKPQTVIEEGFEEVKNGNFYPFLILQPGQTARGIMENVRRIEEEVVKKGKKDVKIRMFYDIKLTVSAEGLSAKKEKMEADAGEGITIPGAGDLDAKMEKAVLAISGKELAPGEGLQTQDYVPLLKREFIITRQADDTMKKGTFKGNKVKVYTVQHRAVA